MAVRQRTSHIGGPYSVVSFRSHNKSLFFSLIFILKCRRYHLLSPGPIILSHKTKHEREFYAMSLATLVGINALPNKAFQCPGKVLGALHEKHPNITLPWLCLVHSGPVTLYVAVSTGSGPSAHRQNTLKCILATVSGKKIYDSNNTQV
jgi:hypothetical protein